ncbi:hypothetical protein AURDEDRAFT_114737 [Auricularia subglabra TFB-10046 SS5]|nr:hypothetical protein AURDEDRAFT_114737 [Auricularia subglabra TFB-10046 SS5]
MTEGPNEYVSFLPELDDFTSTEYEPISQPASSPLPEPAPASKRPSLVRRQRVSRKVSTSSSRAKRLEVLPLVSEEDEPTSSAWSTDEDTPLSPSVKKTRKHRPRPLGFISTSRLSVVADLVISPAAFHDDSTDDDIEQELLFTFPHPPQEVGASSPIPSSPTCPRTPTTPDALTHERSAQSPTPSVASSSSSTSSASPRTPSHSDDETSPVLPLDPRREKPLPPRPRIRHSDGVVENDPDAERDDLWERRINEIFSLLTSSLDNPLNAEEDDQVAPSGPVAPLHAGPTSPTSPSPSRRRGSYAHLIPKRPPPAPPVASSSRVPMSPLPPSTPPHNAMLNLNVPRARPTPPRSPVPTDIPVDVRPSDAHRRASLASSFASSSTGFPSSLLDEYFAVPIEAVPVRLRSRFSTSTRASSASGHSAASSSRQSKSSCSANSRTSGRSREGLRRKGIPVELFMRPSP